MNKGKIIRKGSNRKKLFKLTVSFSLCTLFLALLYKLNQDSHGSNIDEFFRYEDYLHALAFIEKLESVSTNINDQVSLPTTAGRVRTVEISSEVIKPSFEPKFLNSGIVFSLLRNIILRHGKHKDRADELAHRIILESARSGYDPLFVAAVIKSESAFNQYAKSHVGATGLMQIMPSTGKVIEKFKDFEPIIGASLTDPNYNLRLGIRYLKYLDEMFNRNKVLVLIAYNWGPGRVLDAFSGKRKVPPEVIKYTTKILSDHAKWIREASQA